ncbi:MAG TPA: hypothetical protein VIY26_12665 [Acidimicrobiales bacterium]
MSAFAGSDLDMILRAQGVRTPVLAAIATSGVVLVVLRDGSVDADEEEVYRVLLDKVFPCQADVLSVDEWVAGMQR